MTLRLAMTSRAPAGAEERRRARMEALPVSLPPRGLSRVQAAAYIGVGTTKFDEMVADGRMPRPKQIDARNVWDVRRLDAAFEALPDAEEGGDDPWGGVAV